MPSLPPISERDVALAERAPPVGAFDAPVEDAHRPILFETLLRLGDDSLILGQRLSEHCGHAASVEVDLSIANIALDLVGQATYFLDLAGKAEGAGRDGDALAFRRDVLDFRNCLLVEQPNGDFARIVVRQFFFSTWQHLLLGRLAGSTFAPIAEIAAKAVKEVAYHRELAGEWVIRLGDGTEESRQRTIDGIDWTARFLPELFEMDESAGKAAGAGFGVDVASFRDEYDAAIAAVLGEAGLPLPPAQRPILGGRRGHHSEHLGHLLAVMQFLPRTYPDAKW